MSEWPFTRGATNGNNASRPLDKSTSMYTTMSASHRPEAERLESLAPRQLLHAAALTFTHPITGARVALRSEWPLDLRAALADAAVEANLLAEANPLQYLGFFASDG